MIMKGGIRIVGFTFLNMRQTVNMDRFWKKQGLVIK